MKPNKMKAVVRTKYGPAEVLQLKEINKPTPGENELLIEIKASAVTMSDIFIRSSNIPLKFKIPMRLFMGVFKPRKKIIGLVFSGIVTSMGKTSKYSLPATKFME